MAASRLTPSGKEKRGMPAPDGSAQRAAAERARHAGNYLLLLVRRYVLSSELRLHVGNNLGVKRITASRAGGPSGQVLSGDGL